MNGSHNRDERRNTKRKAPEHKDRYAAQRRDDETASLRSRLADHFNSTKGGHR
jgi:hypothetical protein